MSRSVLSQEEDHGEVGALGVQELEDVEAVHAVQDQVEHDDVEPVLERTLHGGATTP